MDRVEVEKRKFTPREKKYWFSFLIFFGAIILIQIVGIIISFFDISATNWLNLYVIFNIITSILILIFFSITIYFFFNEARRHYVAEWSDHKYWYRVQAIGILVAIITNLYLDLKELQESKKDENNNEYER